MKYEHEKILKSLKRLLANGPLTHLPGRKSDLEILLALATTQFAPRQKYRETEVNDLLQKWLEPFCSPLGVDHVTVRRCLVDARFLARDVAGSTYETGLKKPAEVLPDSARHVEPGQLLAEIRLQRRQRKRERAGGHEA
jgi:hypothetical protein